MEIFTAALGLGLEARDLTILQVSLRGLLVFVAGIITVRLADKRFLSRKTAFDAVLGFILASMLARAINGSAPFVPTLVGGLVLVFAHRLLAALSCRWHWIGTLVKGSENLIIAEGKVDESLLRKHNLSKRDLLEDLRLKQIASPEDVREGRLERSGELSVIQKSK